jgi:hypothetical protein
MVVFFPQGIQDKAMCWVIDGYANYRAMGANGSEGPRRQQGDALLGRVGDSVMHSKIVVR